MSCNRQHVAAAVCGFVEELTGEKVTQADWHGLVSRAKEQGYDTGRARVDVGHTRTDLRALGVAEGNLEAADNAIAAVGWQDTPGNLSELSSGTGGKLPTYTKNMESVVRMMTQQGVRESLDAVRAARKGSDGPITDQEIQQRMILRSPALGPEFEPYEFSVTGPDIVSHDVVWARSAKEAKRTVDEWAVRFRGQSEFTSEVRKAESDEPAAPKATLAGQEFTVTTGEFSSYPDGKMTMLTGKRGGQYFLRPFTGEQTGLFEVVNWKSGAPLRDKSGKAVRVTAIGDVIERAE